MIHPGTIAATHSVGNDIDSDMKQSYLNLSRMPRFNMLVRTFAVCVTAIVLSMSSQAHAAPSFDCSNASLPDEKAICANVDLSALDVAISDGYKRLVPDWGAQWPITFTP